MIASASITPASPPVWRVLAWSLGLSGVLGWLAHPRAGLPGPPADRSAAGWRTWIEQTPAVDLAAATVRGAAIAAAGWLLALLLVGLVARACHAATTLRVLDRLSLGLLRRVLLPAVGATLVVAPAMPAAASAAAPTTDPRASTFADEADGLHENDETGAGMSGPGWAVLRPVAPDSPPPGRVAPPSAAVADPTPTPVPVSTTVPATPAPTPTPTPAETESAAGPTPASTWLVQPGDHLWSIAAHTLTAAWDRTPDDAEVAGYWRTVIEANRDRLLLPDEPDLILPGQTFTLPPPPPAPPAVS